MPTKPKIRLLVADDHEMVRCGVKSLLAGTEIKIVAEAPSGNAAVKLALAKDLNVVLLDVRMPDGDGLTALGRIKLAKPNLPVLLFSAFDNPVNIAKAVALGASGFLLKGCKPEELLKAIRRAAAGKNAWSRVKRRGVGPATRTARVGILEASVSEREGEVLRHMANGLTNEQIAAAMNIGSHAVKTYVKAILRKIGVSHRTQAALWAIRNGLA